MDSAVCRLRLFTSSLSLSSWDLSGASDGGGPRDAPSLCRRHRPPRLCQQPDCTALHFCPLFADGFCPREDAECRWGHTVASARNKVALQRHRLSALPEQQLQWLVRGLLQRTAPVSDSEYRHQLRQCQQYAATAACSSALCFGLHLCPRLVEGGCMAGVRCQWNHQVTSVDNLMVLLRLRCANLDDEDVLQLLDANRRLDDAADSGQSDLGSDQLDPVRHSDICRDQSDLGEIQSGLDFDKSDLVGRQLDLGHDQLDTGDMWGAGRDQPVLGRNQSGLSNDRSNIDGRQMDLGGDQSDLAERQSDLGSERSDRSRGDGSGVTIKWETATGRPHQTAAAVDATDSTGGSEISAVGGGGGSEVSAVGSGGGSNAPAVGSGGGSEISAVGCGSEASAGGGGSEVSAVHSGSEASAVGSSDGSEASAVGSAGKPEVSAVGSGDGSEVSAVGSGGGSDAPAVGSGGGSEVSAVGSEVSAIDGGSEISAVGGGSKVSAVGSAGGSEVSAFGSGGGSEASAVCSGGGFEVSAGDATSSGGGSGISAVGAVGSSGGSGVSAGGANSSGGGSKVSSAGAVGSSGGSEVSDEVVVGSTGCSKACGASATSNDGGSEVFASGGGGSKASSAGAVGSAGGSEAFAGGSGDMQQAAHGSTGTQQQQLSVCRHYCFPAKCADGERCQQLHLCRFFVAGICPYVSDCTRQHSLTSPHNRRVLAALQMTSSTQKQVLSALRTGWLQQNPVTSIECHFLVQLCRPYMNGGGCMRGDSCTRLHVCESYVYGTCSGRPGCRRSHQLNSPFNAAILRRLELHNMTATKVLDLLTSKVPAKKAWDSWALGQRVRMQSDSGSPTTQQNKPATSAAPPPFKPAIAPPKLTVSYSRAVVKPEPRPPLPPPLMAAETERVPAAADNRQLAAAGSSEQLKEGDGRFAVAGRSEQLEAAGDGQLAVAEDSEQLAVEVKAELSPPRLCVAHAACGLCPDSQCHSFHVCGFFLANLCRRDDNRCSAGHSFQTEHNLAVMARHQLMGGSPEHFQALLDDITFRSRITFHGDAQLRVQMCIPYNSPGGCAAAQCARFHVCHRYLAGRCGSDGACDRSHRLDGSHNLAVWKTLGLRRFHHSDSLGDWATDQDLLELLRAKLGVPAGRAEHKPAEKPPSAAEDKLARKPTSGAEDKPAGNPTCNAEDKPAAKPTIGAEDKPAGNPSRCAEYMPAGKPTNGAKTGTAQTCREATGAVRNAAPPLCGRQRRGLPCGDTGCRGLHLCPHWLRDGCRRGGAGGVPCTLSHRLDTPHNQQLLGVSGQKLDPGSRRALLTEVAEAAGVRSSTVYTQLRVCLPYNQTDGCDRGPDCPRLHICQRYVAGTCTGDCSLSHSTMSSKNRRRLSALDLGDAEQHEVLELLRAVHGARSCPPAY